MNISDFIIGALLVNAMPHLIFGLTKTYFLGLFGFSPKGNISYALLQLFLCGFLFHLSYGLEKILTNGFLIGGITVLVLYFLLGKFFVNFYRKKKNNE